MGTKKRLEEAERALNEARIDTEDVGGAIKHAILAERDAAQEYTNALKAQSGAAELLSCVQHFANELESGLESSPELRRMIFAAIAKAKGKGTSNTKEDTT